MAEAGGRTMRLGPLQVQKVRGEPYVVGGRRLVPVARIVSLGKARGMVGLDRISGWAGGLAWIRPVAVLVETPEGEQRIPIEDSTATVANSLLALGVAVGVVLAAVRLLARR